MKHPLVMITGLASLLRITSLRRLALLAVAVVVCQALATPSQAQLAPNPPGIDNSYFGKEKDGKKEKPTKAIRAAKCQQCQGARDALQEAIENWYQFQSDQAQKDINAENAKGAKADKNKLTN